MNKLVTSLQESMIKKFLQKGMIKQVTKPDGTTDYELDTSKFDTKKSSTSSETNKKKKNVKPARLPMMTTLVTTLLSPVFNRMTARILLALPKRSILPTKIVTSFADPPFPIALKVLSLPFPISAPMMRSVSTVQCPSILPTWAILPLALTFWIPGKKVPSLRCRSPTPTDSARSFA